MFQNISKDTTEEEIKISDNRSIKNIIKSIIKGQSVLLYIFSFMLSCIDGIGLNYSIFAYAILAATISNGIPVGVIFIFTLIGTLIKFGTAGLLSYIFTSAILIMFILMFKPKRLLLEYESEKVKLGKYVFASVFLGQAVRTIFPRIFNIRFTSIDYFRNDSLYFL